MFYPRLLAFAATIASVVAFTATPASAAYSDPLTSLPTSAYGLIYHSTPAAALNALDNALPNVGVATVVGDTNHTNPACTGTNAASLPVAPAATQKFCWEAADASTT